VLLRKAGRLLKEGARGVIRELLAAINGASILGFDGGVPDLHEFALKILCSECGDAIKAKIQSGDAIGIGRSAGAMILVGDVFSNEPEPGSWSSMVGTHSMTGLQVLGDGISIRPHFNNKLGPPGVKCMALHDWAAVANSIGYSGGVITIPNDSGVLVSDGGISWIPKIESPTRESINIQSHHYTVFDHGACEGVFEQYKNVECEGWPLRELMKFAAKKGLPLLPEKVDDIRNAWRTCDRYKN